MENWKAPTAIIGMVAVVVAVCALTRDYFDVTNSSGQPKPPTNADERTHNLKPTTTVVPSPSTAAPTPAQEGNVEFTKAPPSPTRVAMTVLCGLPEADSYFCGSEYQSQPIQVGGKLFVFAARMRNAQTQPPRYDQILRFPKNKCTKLVIEFALDDRLADPGSVGNIRLSQTAVSPVLKSVDRGSVGALTINLDGGPFELEGNSTDGSEVYVNGYAICNSPSGT